jgi:hypothetical protein
MGAGNSNNPNAACRAGGSLACRNRFCGDGIVDNNFGEECDNPTNPAVCSSSCELVSTGTPWISSSEGSVYATGGYSGITLQNVSTLNPPITLAAYGYDYSKPVNLAEFILYAGNTSLPVGFRSENNFVGTNYTNDALKVAGSSTLYAYMKENIATKGTITNLTLAQLNSGNMHTQLAVAQNALVIRERIGDFAINSGAICNVKGVFLISGNLTIDPDVIKSGATNGCIYIVGGNVTVGAGLRKNSAAALASEVTAYDVIEGLFIVDGQFNAPLDVFNDGRKGDGLYLRGGLISERVALGRDLTGYSNTRQPSEVFVYDPRYIGIPELANILDTKEISLREF